MNCSTEPGGVAASPLPSDLLLRRRYRSPELTIRGRRFAWGERTYIMAIINVTPDSFSGDGTGGDPAKAAELARRFEAAGADIIDIGAESSRPGAEPLAAEVELDRLMPSLVAVRAVTNLPISVDTYHATTARRALEAGADMLNDIWGLRFDPEMARVAAEAGVPVVAMHNQRGRPFHELIADIACGFEASLAIAADAGIPPSRIILDPGFGFGWTPEQNLEMVRRLRELWRFDLPLLLGPSRKSTIGLVLDAPVDQRLEGTAAVAALAIAGGVDILRVHDVEQVVKVARMADAVVRGRWRAQ
ncbi:Dihydropteroate synthase [bacterium HR29]|jgi:dihydropteroate synthase|nr:Dihydropteroate synthase [bacterium HR29]